MIDAHRLPTLHLDTHPDRNAINRATASSSSTSPLPRPPPPSSPASAPWARPMWHFPSSSASVGDYSITITLSQQAVLPRNVHACIHAPPKKTPFALKHLVVHHTNTTTNNNNNNNDNRHRRPPPRARPRPRPAKARRPHAHVPVRRGRRGGGRPGQRRRVLFRPGKDGRERRRRRRRRRRGRTGL